MKKKTKYVELRAVWGNDDAESTIRITDEEWQELRAGAEEEFDAKSWYEGQKYEVLWRFADGRFSIYGEEGRECVLDCSVDELHVLS